MANQLTFEQIEASWQFVAERQFNGKEFGVLANATEDDIRELVELGYRSRREHGKLVFIVPNGKFLQFGSVGDWLVKKRSGKLTIVTNYEFVEITHS